MAPRRHDDSNENESEQLIARGLKESREWLGDHEDRLRDLERRVIKIETYHIVIGAILGILSSGIITLLIRLWTK